VGGALADRGVETLRATVPSDRPSAEEFFTAHGFAHRGTRRSPAGDESIVIADPRVLA
jgi:hypothetical protein